MKILICTPATLPVPAVKGGAVETLLELFIKQNNYRQDNNITIITKKNVSVKYNQYKSNLKFEFVPENIFVNIIDRIMTSFFRIIKRNNSLTNVNFFWLIRVIVYSRRILKKNHYDYVIIENAPILMNIFNNKILKKKYKNKIFFHAHNVIENKKSNLRKLKKCTGIIFVSSFLKYRFLENFPDQKIKYLKVVTNSVREEFFFSKIKIHERKTIFEQLCLKENSIKIIFSGRLSPEKGILELIEAVKMINIKYELIIIGKSYFGDSISTPFERELITKTSSIKDNIHFTGYIPNENLWKYYQIADIAVLPSIWEEPAGLTMIESLLSGLPIITTNNGGIPESLEGVRSAFLLENDNNLSKNIALKIEYIAKNIEYYESIAGKEKTKFFNKFSNKKMYNDIINCLEEHNK